MILIVDLDLHFDILLSTSMWTSMQFNCVHIFRGQALERILSHNLDQIFCGTVEKTRIFKIIISAILVKKNLW